MRGHSILLVVANLIVATIASTASTARAAWTYVNLHPAGATDSALFGVGDGQQVGYAVIAGGPPNPALWSGTAGSYVSLKPPAVLLGRAFGASQGRQVGELAFYPGGHAILWSGTAGSYVDLQPPGTFASEAHGIRGNQQVGAVTFELPDGVTKALHASLWSGTAASWIDLNPAGASSSIAYGVDGNQQVGQASLVGSHAHASLWTGTAASWVDLEPAPAPGVFEIFGSVANAVQGGQQVGTVTYNTFRSPTDHAGYWSGTAASWVDLNPDTAHVFSVSRANAVFGGYQVGQTDGQFCDVLRCDDGEHAAFWHGTRDSWVDLESFLPANYVGSNAFGVWTDGHIIQVAGAAYNSTLNRSEAILWTNTVPEPASGFAMLLGVMVLGMRRGGLSTVHAATI